MLHLSSLLVISSDIVVLFVLVFLLISQLKTEGGELRGGTEGLEKRGFRKGIKYGFCLFLLVCIFFVIHIFSFIFCSEWDQSDPEWELSDCKIEHEPSASKSSESVSNFPEANLESGGRKREKATAEQKRSPSSPDRETER